MKKKISLCFLLLFFVMCLTPKEGYGFFLGKYKEVLLEVQGLYETNQLDLIYASYLEDIPSFNIFSKYSEELFYYYALTCIGLGKFDEAEGYLYQIKTKKKIPYYPEKLDYVWGVLKDDRGDADEAYHQYLLYSNLYPEGDRLPYVYLRLGQLAQEMAYYKMARKYWDELLEKFSDSYEAQLIRTSDDYGLIGPVISFGKSENLSAAMQQSAYLANEGIEVTVHVSFNHYDQFYYLVLSESPEESLESALLYYQNLNYEVSFYPEKSEGHERS